MAAPSSGAIRRQSTHEHAPPVDMPAGHRGQRIDVEAGLATSPRTAAAGS
jgi:hypothetical protein